MEQNLSPALVPEHIQELLSRFSEDPENEEVREKLSACLRTPEGVIGVANWIRYKESLAALAKIQRDALSKEGKQTDQLITILKREVLPPMLNIFHDGALVLGEESWIRAKRLPIKIRVSDFASLPDEFKVSKIQVQVPFEHLDRLLTEINRIKLASTSATYRISQNTLKRMSEHFPAPILEKLIPLTKLPETSKEGFMTALYTLTNAGENEPALVNTYFNELLEQEETAPADWVTKILLYASQDRITKIIRSDTRGNDALISSHIQAVGPVEGAVLCDDEVTVELKYPDFNDLPESVEEILGSAS